MLKQYINPEIKKINKSIFTLLLLMSFNSMALESDKQADFNLLADDFKNLPEVKSGLTQVKFWGNVSIEQGTLIITADEAIVFNGNEGVFKVILTGNPVQLEQFIDVEFGKIDVKAQTINYMVKDEMLLMTGDVVINSKVQGEMSGEKITMNLKTNEIKGSKSGNKRVKLVIKPRQQSK